MKREDAIYLLGADGTLERVPLQTYPTEDLLQKLIEDYPELLASEQIDPDDPPRWFLVKREAGIPDGDASSDRWSADHLLLDHLGRPTIVEVKRSSDTRIRREVVGQMLDYAANATVYWPVDRIRALAQATCGGPEEVDAAICELIGAEPGEHAQSEVENFWRRVESNLRTGELRLLFVADELPRELKRIIEFLNEHMPLIEVLGVEIREFAGSSMRALVPRIVGQTERARQDKATVPARKINTNEFLERCPEWCRTFFVELFESAAKEGFQILPGQKGFSLCMAQHNGKPVSPLWGFPPGAYGRPAPALYVFPSSLSPFEHPDMITQTLVQLAPFKRSPTQLSLLLEPGNLKAARDVLSYLWQVGRKIQTSTPTR